MAVKFTYFEGRGLGEPIRQILAYGDLDWEDVRVPFGGIPAVVPPEIKARARWGQLPIVEFEGKQVAQSLAIGRYFARKANLVPEDPYEAALCDEYVDATREAFMSLYPAILLEDAEAKKTKLEEIEKTLKSKYLEVFESIVKKNGGKFLVGDKLTWADIHLTYFFDNFIILLEKDYTEGYPNLKNMKATVENTPKIKAWLEKRPKAKF